MFSFICCLGWYEKHQLTTVNFLSKQNALLGVIFPILWRYLLKQVLNRCVFEEENSVQEERVFKWPNVGQILVPLSMLIIIIRCRGGGQTSSLPDIFKVFGCSIYSIRTVIGPGSFPGRDHPRTLSQQKVVTCRSCQPSLPIKFKLNLQIMWFFNNLIIRYWCSC